MIRALAIALAAIQLTGCVALIPSPDVVCNMKVDYMREIRVQSAGEVRLTWTYVPASQWPDPVHPGFATCSTTNGLRSCHLRLEGPAPDFHDVCALARLGHEVGHGMGGMHE